MTTFLKAVAKLALLTAGLATAAAGCVDDSVDREPLREPFAGAEVAVPGAGQEPPPIIVDPGFPDAELPHPSVFAKGLFSPRSLLVEGDSIYWTESLADEVFLSSMHTDGGANHVVAKFVSSPFAMVTDEFGVYWSAPAEGSVGFASHRDHALHTLHESDAPLALAITADDAIWTDAAGCLVRAPLDGKAGKTVGCTDDTSSTLVLAGNDAYFATTAGALFRASLGVDATVEKLATGHSFSARIIADDQALYWLDAQRRGLMKYSFASEQISVMAQGQYAPIDIAQDRFYLYFTTQGDGEVKRLLKTGGQAETLVYGQDQPGELVVDGEFLYWINEGDGSVMRVLKNFSY